MPQTVIIDTMFMINIKLLRRTMTIADYGKLVFHHHVLHHYRNGTHEVQSIFDNRHTQIFDLKQYERARWYSKKATTFKQHQHQLFDPDLCIPQRWQDCLECGVCKRAKVKQLDFSFYRKFICYL